MFKFIKVTGQSLSPEYKEGDFVAIITVPFFSFKPGKTIVFNHPIYGTLIKKIARIDPEGFYVVGNHPESVDSRKLGLIDRQSILGTVFWHIPKPKR